MNQADVVNKWALALQNADRSRSSTSCRLSQQIADDLAVAHREWQKLTLVTAFVARVARPLKASSSSACAFWNQIEDPKMHFGSLDLFEAVHRAVSEVESGPSVSIGDARKFSQAFVEWYLTKFAFQESPCTFIKRFVLHACALADTDQPNPWAALDRTRRSTNSQVAAKWVNDSEASHCFSCNNEFTLFTRRHHCRLCGNVFCGDCTTKTRDQIPKHTGPVKVCDVCYSVAGVFETSQTASASEHMQGLVRTVSIEHQYVYCLETEKCKHNRLTPAFGGRRTHYVQRDDIALPALFSPTNHPDLPWEVKMDGENTDSDGWQYSFKLSSTEWAPTISTKRPKTWVRRRCWFAPTYGDRPAAASNSRDIIQWMWAEKSMLRWKSCNDLL
eukprot:COSAG05_NODE_5180_length_1244_cov_1.580786_1_plen_387_part_10